MQRTLIVWAWLTMAAAATAAVQGPAPIPLASDADHAAMFAAFRLLQQQDELGVVAIDALPKAIEALRELKGKSARAFIGGVPTGPQLPESERDVMPLTAGISPGGWTWLGPGNIGGRTRSLVIHPTTPTTMWVGSVGGGIWKSTNGGTTWAPLYDFMGSLAVATLVLDPTNPNVLYAGTGEGFFNSDAIRGAGIFKSSNGGATWSALAATQNINFLFVNRLAMSKDGTRLLAATRNGLFRSQDAGATWTTLPAPVNVEILDVDCHPTDSTRCIAGGRGGRAFVSVNGGTTWTAATGLPSVAGFAGRVETTYATSLPTTVYASVDVNGGELYRSVDGGQSFVLRNTGTNYLGGQGWYDNALWAGDPSTANMVLVGGLDLHRSTDGGGTFTRISNWWQAPFSAHADHHTIVAHPAYNGTTNKTVLFGNDGGVYRAADVSTVSGVVGWQELNNNYGVTQFFGAAAHPASNKIVGGTQDNGTLVYTSAGGTEGWTTMFGGDGGWCAADPTDANFLYGEYVYLRLHRSTNGGTSSAFIDAGLGDAGTAANFIAPFILDPNNSNVLLAGGRSLWRSTNAKAPTPTWAAIKASINVNISAIATQKGNADNVFVGHNGGEVFKTSNGTAAAPTWTRLDDVAGSPLPNRYCTRIAIDPANANQVFVAFGGYSANNLWRTTDGGSTWTAISAGLPEAPIRAIALHPESATHVYIGTEVGVFASENGGTTWSATNEGPTNCSVDELLLMDKKLVAVTHGRGLFAIDLPALTAVSGDRLGYAWANNATAASYTPSSIYAYNSAGGPITITRGAVGVYTVTFSGLGSPRPGGHVQVTAYGATSDTAKVASWSSAGSDFRVNVRCFNHAGSPVDTLYTVLVMWPPTAGPVPDLGEDPMLDTIEPTPGARAIR